MIPRLVVFEVNGKCQLSAIDDGIVTECHNPAVTFCDEDVNVRRQLPSNVRFMDTKTPILLLTLLVAPPLAADQSELRYRFSGSFQLSMQQELYPGGRTDPIADRRFDMTFEFDDGNPPAATLATIKGSYTAHGMKQILSTRHLNGQPVMLTSDGRTIGLDDPGGDVDLGLIVDRGLYPSELLVDVLPILPDGPVTTGSTWETVRPVRSLEGWAWASGEIRCQHNVVGVTEKGGQMIVQVQSKGATATKAAEGSAGFEGEGTLTRRIDWSFNADTGQLLSLSLQQEGSGKNQLPQGLMEVRQVTRIELEGA